MDLELLLALQSILSTAFFSFATAVIILSLTVLLVRARPWCSCAVCRAYVSSSWRADHGSLCDWYAHLLRRAPTRTVHIHVLGNIITANRSNVEHILKANFDNYPKGKQFQSILGDFLGRGIFNSDGSHWLFQRKLASMELGSMSVRHYAFGVVQKEVRERLLPFLFLASSSAGGDGATTSSSSSPVTLDLQDVFRRFTFDTICQISFGMDPRCLELARPASEFAAAFDTASCVSAARATCVSAWVWKLKRLLNVGSERELLRAISLVDELAREVINKRRKEMMTNKTTADPYSKPAAATGDLLTRFMDTIHDDRYLRDIVVSFLLAGRDTVAFALTALFYLLASNPRAEKAMLNEIQLVLDRHHDSTPTTITWDQLREMQYVHAAVYEAMRLYPPVQLDSKFAASDDILPDGTYVRKGTRVSFSPYAMGRLAEEWGDDCMEFRPERWLRPSTTADPRGGERVVFVPECLYKYPVFQAGLRVCLGQELAIMEVKAVAVGVMRNFTFDVLGAAKGRPLIFVPGLTATLRGGLPAIVRRRQEISAPALRRQPASG